MEYQLSNELGRGSYGVVYRAKHIKTGTEYAIKRVDTSMSSHYDKMNLINELRILSTHKCPFIIAFKDAFVTRQFVHLVTELAIGGDLHGLIKHQVSKPIEERRVWDYVLQLCVAVNYLHTNNVIHRDLKPANVFIDGTGIVKLGDVGIVKILKPYMMYGQTQVGTPLYMSPEIMRRERYDERTDVWSIGCILYELMTLKPAFCADNMADLRMRIFNRHVNANACSMYSSQLSNACMSMLVVGYRMRPRVRDILAKHTMRLKERGLSVFTDKSVKGAFNVACAVPRRPNDWREVVNNFCRLKTTVRMDTESRHKMNIVRNLQRMVTTPQRVAPRKTVTDGQDVHRIRALLKEAEECVVYYSNLLHELENKAT